jgi:hypothetical protein
MPTATSKPVDVTYMPMTDWSGLAKALHDAEALGYFGVVANEQSKGWSLSLTGPGQARLVAQIGQVLIWNGTVMSVMNQTDFAGAYTPKAGGS